MVPCEVLVRDDLWARAMELPAVQGYVETRAIEARPA
jgi:hypothetical protein